MKLIGMQTSAPRRGAIVLSLAFAFILLLTAVQILSAEEEVKAPTDLSNSDKSVNLAEAVPGQTVRYTVVLSNSGSPSLVTVTDTFGAELTYAGEFTQDPDGGVYTYTNGVLVWSGFAGAVPVTLSFNATLTNTLLAGDTVTNSVQIDDGGTVITRSASTMILGDVDYVLNFPIIKRSLPPVVLSASRPTSANAWTMSWTSGESGVVTGYLLQESQTADFSSGITEYSLGAVTTQPVVKPVTANSVYYYRIRAISNLGFSPWSNTVQVRGAYFDGFDDPSTGWDLARSSFFDITVAFYGTGAEAGNYVLIVDDRWDWMIASPLMPAPVLPYVIEYRAKVHEPSNLVSGGFTFAGDWNGGPCIDYSNPYENTNCFNRFHNLNFIWYGPLKLLYEQIDQLVWCPTCGGSLLKRIGSTTEAGIMLPDGPSFDYHTYRIEVRDSGVTFLLDGAPRFSYSDTRYLDQPYFGVFASTEEYKPSIWFFDYVSVTPLD